MWLEGRGRAGDLQPTFKKEQMEGSHSSEVERGPCPRALQASTCRVPDPHAPLSSLPLAQQVPGTPCLWPLPSGTPRPTGKRAAPQPPLCASLLHSYCPWQPPHQIPWGAGEAIFGFLGCFLQKLRSGTRTSLGGKYPHTRPGLTLKILASLWKPWQGDSSPQGPSPGQEPLRLSHPSPSLQFCNPLHDLKELGS